MAENTLRQRCEELLAQVPDSGLDETLGTLQRIIEFWEEQDALPPLPPKIPPKQFRAKISATTIRPDFSFDPDDILTD